MLKVCTLLALVVVLESSPVNQGRCCPPDRFTVRMRAVGWGPSSRGPYKGIARTILTSQKGYRTGYSSENRMKIARKTMRKEYRGVTDIANKKTYVVFGDKCYVSPDADEVKMKDFCSPGGSDVIRNRDGTESFTINVVTLGRRANRTITMRRTNKSYCLITKISTWMEGGHRNEASVFMTPDVVAEDLLEIPDVCL